MSKIETEFPTAVLTALAAACGFHLVFDHSPGVDEWTLSTGHGAKYYQYIGTRQSVCAFLAGYAAMQIQTTQVLNELNSAHQKLILDMRARLSIG